MKNNEKTPKRTQHRQISNKRSAQRAIRKLSKNWKKLDLVERGESLIALLALGCSRRGLARDLGQSATSIRRHTTLANLPDAQREAVKAGKSAKRVLALKAQEDRRNEFQKRITEDSETGVISDQLADCIIEFCKTNRDGVCGTELERMPLFYNQVGYFLTRADWEGQPSKKIRKSLPLKKRFRLTCPKPGPQEIRITFLARWLAIFLKSEASEEPILVRALQKADAREKELEIEKPKPQQLLRERVNRLAYLSESPPPRKY